MSEVYRYASARRTISTASVHNGGNSLCGRHVGIAATFVEATRFLAALGRIEAETPVGEWMALEARERVRLSKTGPIGARISRPVVGGAGVTGARPYLKSGPPAGSGTS
jgi:hypothetical protein